ncbi:MAG: GNAT family N-acetyltransferase [Motilibacteraceae bacterium]
MVLVRKERADDVDAVRDVVRAAFGSEHEVRLVDALRAHDSWRDLSYVAVEPAPAREDADDVVGHVCFTRGWVDAPAALVEVLVLSPLSVRPDRQRRGVGQALVRAALEDLRGLGHALVFLEGSPAYYPRFGFRPGGELGFTPPSVRIPPAAFQVAVLAPYDTDAVGGALVYPDVFWREDAVGRR